MVTNSVELLIDVLVLSVQKYLSSVLSAQHAIYPVDAICIDDGRTAGASPGQKMWGGPVDTHGKRMEHEPISGSEDGAPSGV